MGTKDKGIIFKPDKKTLTLTIFFDTDFVDQWSKMTQMIQYMLDLDHDLQ